MRPMAKSLRRTLDLKSTKFWSQNRLSKTKSPTLTTHEAALMLGTKRFLVTRAKPHTWVLSINTFGKSRNKWLWRAITTLPKTTHTTSTLNAGETSSNYSVKLSLSPHKSSHGTFLDSLTVDLFKIPDVHQRLKRRHTAPAFQTIFY